ncbi:hypothetical protein E2C01_092006 [Portunus trituberculatus]|uniref:Uncharacterized protein n=1 Tax=Portunus trituberculatus TaxID=210409 RepID=A0A5B7JJ08_PORTR|nr:hypothetical protein [Portunus trituberculatus]
MPPHCSMVALLWLSLVNVCFACVPVFEQHVAALAEADKDSTVEEVASSETMEKEKIESPSLLLAEEAENTSEDVLTPIEDAASLSGSDRVSENDMIVPGEESLPEPSEADSPQLEEPLEGREQTHPETDGSQEEEVQQQMEEEEKEEKEEEKEKEEDEIKVEATPEQESDLEAEYDNVEIDAGRAEVVASQATSDSHCLSASSGESHSSHGSDITRTDPPTQVGSSPATAPHAAAALSLHLGDSTTNTPAICNNQPKPC